MQAGVLAAQIIGLEGLDRLDGGRRDKIHFLVDAGQLLQRIEQRRGGCTQQRAGLAGDDGAIRQLDGGGRCPAGLLRDGVSGLLHGAAAQRKACLVHQKFQLVDLALDLCAVFKRTQRLEVPADDLVAGGLAAGGIVHDAVARHVHAHVGGGVVGALACDQLEHRVDHREDLNVAVVVDGGLAVGFQMERVDHVHIVQVGGGGLVGQVHRVLERDVPDGEGLELGITGLDAPLVLVVQLGQAGGHLAAAGAGGRDDHQRALGLDVLVAAIALVAHDAGHVVGVAGDLIMTERPDAQTVQPLFKGFHFGCGRVHGHADAAHEQPPLLEGVDEAQHVQVVGDAVVAAHLAAHDVFGADDDDDLGLVLQLQQHLQLGVRLETGQHTGGVVVIEQLAAEFQIQLVVELCDPLADVLGLHLQVFVVVKSFFHSLLLFLKENPQRQPTPFRPPGRF